MGNKCMYRLNMADIAAAVMVTALSIAPLFSFNKLSPAGAIANIYENGKLMKKADISVNSVYRVKNVEVQVADRKVRVLRSDCPHHICVNTGWISSPAQTIVCVPNRILVEITNDDRNQELNAVSY